MFAVITIGIVITVGIALTTRGSVFGARYADRVGRLG
jgi:hypothetical protein